MYDILSLQFIKEEVKKEPARQHSFPMFKKVAPVLSAIYS